MVVIDQHKTRWLFARAFCFVIAGGLWLLTSACELRALQHVQPGNGGATAGAGGGAGEGAVAGNGGVGGEAGEGGAGGAPLRQLVTRRLFGQMPVTNRFLDPQFALVNGVGWNPYDYDTWQVAEVTRVFLPKTPLDQPALKLEPATGDQSGQVLGEAKSTSGPIEVSIWLGRAAGASPTQASSALLGLYLNQTASAVDLAPDPSQPPTTLSEITWQRFVAQLADGPVAMTYLRVENNGDSSLYLTSPILVVSETPASQTSNRRALTGREERALKAAAIMLRERFGRDHPLRDRRMRERLRYPTRRR